MNLKSRLAQLDKRRPQMDQEQRQAMIASIQQWLDELAVKAKTDREARLYLEAIRDMLDRGKQPPPGGAGSR